MQACIESSLLTLSSSTESVVPKNTCRLCLQVKTKLFKLSDTYKDFIENILFKECLYYIPREGYIACSICMCLISKLFNFIQMICNAQKIIHDLLLTNNCTQLTIPILKSVNRNKNGLNKFCSVKIPVIDTNDNYDKDFFYNTSLSNNKNEESNIKLDTPNNFGGFEYEKQENKVTKQTRYNTENQFVTKDSLIEIKNIVNENVEEFNKNKHLTASDSVVSESRKVLAFATNPSPKNDCLKSLSENKENEKEFRGSESSFVDGIDDINSEGENVEDIDEETNDPLVGNKKELKHSIIEIDTDSVASEPTEIYAEVIKPRSKYFSETEASSDSSVIQNKSRKRKNEDKDYCPDSTSHSEDSVYDSFDDEGKKIKVPKDNRVYPMKCDHCNYDVPKKIEHYRHYLIAHPNIKYPYALEKTATCSICGYRTTQTAIFEHERGHIRQNVKCTECPKIFKTRRQMTKHRYSVHYAKGLTCDYCSKTIKQRSTFILHLRTHTGEKPFKCHICDAAFAHSGNRTIHIRSKHQNIKYVPKKRKGTKKIRRNKNKYDSDTELEASEDEIEQTRKKRTKRLKRRNITENGTKNKTVDIKPHSDQKNKGDNTDKTRQQINNKRTLKTNKNKKDGNVCTKEYATQDVSTESDNETLADNKAKKNEQWEDKLNVI